MYVAKFDKQGIFWYAKLLQKEWSEEFFSNRIIIIKEKKFLIKILATLWMQKQIYKSLINKNELEIQNG
jgi:hypothetical protein